VVPFLGLTVATAPGFAHYLTFLGPLAESDGFGSGVVEGLVPAIALTLTMGGAVSAVTRRDLSVRVWMADWLNPRLCSANQGGFEISSAVSRFSGYLLPDSTFPPPPLGL
jgi:hypothetical protein